MIVNSNCQVFTQSSVDCLACDRNPNLRLRTKAVRRRTEGLTVGERDLIQVKTSLKNTTHGDIAPGSGCSKPIYTNAGKIVNQGVCVF